MKQKFNFFINFHSLNFIFKDLVSYYGHRYWWPADNPLEVIEGAILAQNTSWKNAETCVKRINSIAPDIILNMNDDRLTGLIREAGFHKRKTQYLKNALNFYSHHVECAPSFINVRDELLKIKGIGKETADSIALYAFNQRTFPVDAYTIRFFNRYFSLSLSINDYETVREAISGIFEGDILREFHAVIVEHSKKFCRKNPKCENCFLKDKCRFQ